MKAYDDNGEKLIPCEMCENGTWWSECCDGSNNCDCHGQPVNMGTCHVCHGTGWRQPEANKMANVDTIRGRCFIGRGPTSGYWAGK